MMMHFNFDVPGHIKLTRERFSVRIHCVHNTDCATHFSSYFHDGLTWFLLEKNFIFQKFDFIAGFKYT